MVGSSSLKSSRANSFLQERWSDSEGSEYDESDIVDGVTRVMIVMRLTSAVLHHRQRQEVC